MCAYTLGMGRPQGKIAPAYLPATAAAKSRMKSHWACFPEFSDAVSDRASAGTEQGPLDAHRGGLEGVPDLAYFNALALMALFTAVSRDAM